MSINDLGRSRKVYPFFRNPTVPPTVVEDLTVTDVITGNFTASFDQLIRVDPTSDAFSITLPAIEGKSGKTIIIKNVTTSTNQVTILGGGSTIDGSSSFTMDSPRQLLMLFSDGSNWQIGYINAPVTGTGNVAGISTQVQFNDSSAFGASSGLTFNKTTLQLSVGGDVSVGGGDVFLTGSQVRVAASTPGSTAFLFDTNAALIYFGNAATSGINIGSASSFVNVASNLTGSKNLAVNGGNITTTATTANLFNTNATTINIGTGTSATAINIGTGNTSNVVAVNKLKLSNTAAIQNSSGNTAISIAAGASPAVTLAGNLATSLTTVDLFNTTATTINIGGAATAMNIGAASGTTTIGNDLTVTGDLKVTGNDIKSSTNDVAMTLNTKSVSIAGDLTVGKLENAGSGDIVFRAPTDESIDLSVDSGNSNGTVNLFNTSPTTSINFGGAATTVKIGSGSLETKLYLQGLHYLSEPKQINNGDTLSFSNNFFLGTTAGTIYLPSASNMTGASFRIKNNSAATLTISGSGDNINSANNTSITVNTSGSIFIVCRGDTQASFTEWITF